MANPHKHKRRVKLIKPRLQFKLIGGFVGLSALALILQSLLLGLRLSQLSGELPNDGAYVSENTPGMIVELLVFSFGLLLPLSVAVGILLTFRIAGPVYRLEKFCESVTSGERPGDVRLRDGDELVELAQHINAATAPLRKQESRPVPAALPAAVQAPVDADETLALDAPQRQAS